MSDSWTSYLQTQFSHTLLIIIITIRTTSMTIIILIAEHNIRVLEGVIKKNIQHLSSLNNFSCVYKNCWWSGYHGQMMTAKLWRWWWQQSRRSGGSSRVNENLVLGKILSSAIPYLLIAWCWMKDCRRSYFPLKTYLWQNKSLHWYVYWPSCFFASTKHHSKR